MLNYANEKIALAFFRDYIYIYNKKFSIVSKSLYIKDTITYEKLGS